VPVMLQYGTSQAKREILCPHASPPEFDSAVAGAKAIKASDMPIFEPSEVPTNRCRFEPYLLTGIGGGGALLS
jgi:hypothetical protein